MELTERDRAIIDFERTWWTRAGSKERAIREHFGFSPTRYYRQLRSLLDIDAARSYDPLTVKRLQRQRETRLRARLEGRHSHPGTR